MWVTKLLIFPVEIRIYCFKTTKFGQKLAFLVNLGQAMQAYSMPCWLVGWWLWRAGCISQDTYLLYVNDYYYFPARSLTSGKCSVSLWGGPLDDRTWQASINQNAQAGKTYKTGCCWNGIGNIDGISSGTISSGCPNVTMKDTNNRTLCVLGPGAYTEGSFIPKCGNDVVTEYTIGSWGGSTTSSK